MSTDLSIARFLLFQRQVDEFYCSLSGKAAAECGITKPEADVLIFLANNPKYDTARDIARYRGYSKTYVSKAVELLTDKGLLACGVDRRDRRFQHLVSTDGAVPIIKALRETQKRFFLTLTNGISASERELLLSAAERMMKNMDEIERDA